MDKLDFRFKSGTMELSIIINEIKLLDILRYKDDHQNEYPYYEYSELCLREICDALYYKDKDYFWKDDKFSILGCCWGDKNCGPFRIRVIETENTIVWTDFSHGTSRYDKSISKFEFDKEQYLEKVKFLDEIMKSDW